MYFPSMGAGTAVRRASFKILEFMASPGDGGDVRHIRPEENAP
jgi:hypothetical protein